MNRCYFCHWTGPDSELLIKLRDIKNLNERLEPGREVPAGECPRCGHFALQIPPKPNIEEVEYRCAIEIDVTAPANDPRAAAERAWSLLTGPDSMRPVVRVETSFASEEVDLNEAPESDPE